MRSRLNFADAVTEKFGFLHDFGFSVTESSPTIVRYRKGDLDLDVYHGRQSHEIGLGIEHRGVRYSLTELIRISDSEAAGKYRNVVTLTPSILKEGLTTLAELVMRYAEVALRGEPKFFAALENQRKNCAEGYAQDVLAGQLRPKAEEAFRQGNYREAAELYDRIQRCLTPAELKKLAFAKKRDRT
jgi:hypothetical protein